MIRIQVKRAACRSFRLALDFRLGHLGFSGRLQKEMSRENKKKKGQHTGSILPTCGYWNRLHTSTITLIKKMVKFGYKKRKVMRKVRNLRHFPQSIGLWSRVRWRIMETFNDWYNAINAEHGWRRQNHCHNGPRWGTRWRTSKKQHTTHHIDTPHIPHTSRLSFVSFCSWISFFGLPIKSYSGLRPLVYKKYTLKEPDSRLRPIEVLGCENTKNKIK